MADTPYIVLVETTIQRIADPGHPEEYEEVTAYVPVAGLDSGKEPVIANSGPEAARRMAEELGLDLEEFGQRSFRGVPVRNWSGTDATTKLQLVFEDVLPDRHWRPLDEDTPEDTSAPEQAPPEPEPVTAEMDRTEAIEDLPPDGEFDPFDPSMTASGGTEER